MKIVVSSELARSKYPYSHVTRSDLLFLRGRSPKNVIHFWATPYGANLIFSRVVPLFRNNTGHNLHNFHILYAAIHVSSKFRFHTD